MALDYRLVATSTEFFKYKVYPQGSYTIGTQKTDIGTNFAKSRNLRQGSLSFNSLLRHNVTSAPTETDLDFIVHVPIFGSVNSGNRASGNLSPDDTFLLLSPDQTFLLEALNKSAENGIFSLTINYGFIPESLVKDPII